ALDVRIVPGLIAHLLAAGLEEGDVFNPRAANGPADEELAALEHRLAIPDMHAAAHELEERLLALIQVPVEPCQLVVLAVGIVVAMLGVRQLIAAEEHGHALAEQEGGDEVALLSLAHGDDAGIVGGAFSAAVPALVVVGAVLVVLAVGLVVLLVVADQVLEAETIVGGDEVDAGVGLAAI